MYKYVEIHYNEMDVQQVPQQSSFRLTNGHQADTYSVPVLSLRQTFDAPTLISAALLWTLIYRKRD